MPVPITSADAEGQLLERISEVRRSGARLDGEVDDCVKRSTALRRALLTAAFNGELVEQDPNDEPADIALARLGSETMPVRKRAVRRATGAPVKG